MTAHLDLRVALSDPRSLPVVSNPCLHPPACQDLAVKSRVSTISVVEDDSHSRIIMLMSFVSIKRQPNQSLPDTASSWQALQEERGQATTVCACLL